MKKRVFIQVAVTVGSLLVVLVLFEYYLRQTTTHVIKQDLQASGGVVEASPEFLVDNSSGRRRLVPGARVVIKNHYFSGLDVPLVINSLGFRGAELPAKRLPGEFRILVLGDSITIADYLPEEDTYPAQLEHLLSKLPRLEKVRIVNAGIGNIGIQEAREILEESIEQVQPDLVLVGFYLNDSRPPWGFSGEIGDRGWLRRRSLLVETIFRNLEEQQWADEKNELRFGWIEKRETLNWQSSREDFSQLVQAARFDWGAAWEDSSWQVVQNELRQIKALASRRKVPVALVVFPVIYQVQADFLDNRPQEHLAEIAKAEDVVFIDLLSVLRDQRDTDLFYDHCHPTAAGFKFIAEKISHSLREFDLLDGRGDH